MNSFFFKLTRNLWPPFVGAGIHIKKVAKDFTSFDVEMKLHKWNENGVGIHYGGSIYSMTDPFYGMILRQTLGKDYYVVDKSADIKFRKPGKGTIKAHFNIARERIAEIKKEADDNFKAEPRFKAEIFDEAGNLVAEVDKVVYVRRRDKKPQHGHTLKP